MDLHEYSEMRSWANRYSEKKAQGYRIQKAYKEFLYDFINYLDINMSHRRNNE